MFAGTIAALSDKEAHGTLRTFSVGLDHRGGVACQWGSWRIKLPAISLLLSGLLLGSVAGRYNPSSLEICCCPASPWRCRSFCSRVPHPASARSGAWKNRAPAGHLGGADHLGRADAVRLSLLICPGAGTAVRRPGGGQWPHGDRAAAAQRAPQGQRRGCCAGRASLLIRWGDSGGTRLRAGGGHRPARCPAARAVAVLPGDRGAATGTRGAALSALLSRHLVPEYLRSFLVLSSVIACVCPTASARNPAW